MQIYADVTGRRSGCRRVGPDARPRLGDVRRGRRRASAGGYATIDAAARRMARLRDEVYEPAAANRSTYDLLYREYVRLHDYFGRGTDPVMKTLKQIRHETRAHP